MYSSLSKDRNFSVSSLHKKYLDKKIISLCDQDVDGYHIKGLLINFIDHFANPGFFQDKNISEFNFLKYSDETWKFWAGNDIAYTNRLSYIFYLELCEVNNLTVIDFKGENYRTYNPLPAEEIHEDILKKYTKLSTVEDVCKYQRGTLIFKK